MPFTGQSSDSSDGECDDIRGNTKTASLTPSSLGSTDLTMSSPKNEILLLSSSPRKSTASSLGLSPPPLVFTNANHAKISATSVTSDTSFAYTCKGRLQDHKNHFSWRANVFELIQKVNFSSIFPNVLRKISNQFNVICNRIYSSFIFIPIHSHLVSLKVEYVKAVNTPLLINTK